MMNSDQYSSWSCVSTSVLDSYQTTHSVKNSCGGYSEKPHGTVYHKPRVHETRHSISSIELHTHYRDQPHEWFICDELMINHDTRLGIIRRTHARTIMLNSVKVYFKGTKCNTWGRVYTSVSLF